MADGYPSACRFSPVTSATPVTLPGEFTISPAFALMQPRHLRSKTASIMADIITEADSRRIYYRNVRTTTFVVVVAVFSLGYFHQFVASISRLLEYLALSGAKFNEIEARMESVYLSSVAILSEALIPHIAVVSSILWMLYHRSRVASDTIFYDTKFAHLFFSIAIVVIWFVWMRFDHVWNHRHKGRYALTTAPDEILIFHIVMRSILFWFFVSISLYETWVVVRFAGRIK